APDELTAGEFACECFRVESGRGVHSGGFPVAWASSPCLRRGRRGVEERTRPRADRGREGASRKSGCAVKGLQRPIKMHGLEAHATWLRRLPLHTSFIASK